MVELYPGSSGEHSRRGRCEKQAEGHHERGGDLTSVWPSSPSAWWNSSSCRPAAPAPVQRPHRRSSRIARRCRSSVDDPTSSAGQTDSLALMIGVGAVDRAYANLGTVVTRTPLELCLRHSSAAGARVWLKREDLQIVRSYKVRGAYNLISSLPRDVAVTVWSAPARAITPRESRTPVRGSVSVPRIYVPRTTPRQKRDRIRVLGGSRVELRVEGDTYEESAELATPTRSDPADSRCRPSTTPT